MSQTKGEGISHSDAEKSIHLKAAPEKGGNLTIRLRGPKTIEVDDAALVGRHHALVRTGRRGVEADKQSEIGEWSVDRLT
jgi:hypothetical protein